LEIVATHVSRSRVGTAHDRYLNGRLANTPEELHAPMIINLVQEDIGGPLEISSGPQSFWFFIKD